MLPLEWELCFLRLQMVARISASPPFLRTLVRSTGGAPWRTAVIGSLKAFHLLLSEKFEELPCPLVDAAAWEVIWV